MPRFILRYQGEAVPEEHIDLAAASPEVKILDRSPKMLLIEATDDAAQTLAARLPGWTVNPEVRYRIPSTRQGIHKPPGPE